MSKFAWVTLTTNDTYSLGALVLAHSLKRAGTAHQLAVLVTPTVSPAMRDRLKDVYNVVQEVNVLDSQDAANLALLKRPELGVTFTKLHCWRLVQFEKCVFLDADTLVLKNSDELFEREELSAAPDVSWPDCFNSGVFVFRPSVDTFNKITEFAVEHGSFDGGDQGLLNQFFGDWATADIKKHLPFVYNVTAYASYCYLPAFKQFRDKIKILHFAGKLKPWLIQFNSETRTAATPNDYAHAQDLIQHWWNIFCDNVHQSLSDTMCLCLNIITHSTNSNEYYQCYDVDSYIQGQHPQQIQQYVPEVREYRDPWTDYYEQAEREQQQQQNENQNANFSIENSYDESRRTDSPRPTSPQQQQQQEPSRHQYHAPPQAPPQAPPTTTANEDYISIDVNSNAYNASESQSQSQSQSQTHFESEYSSPTANNNNTNNTNNNSGNQQQHQHQQENHQNVQHTTENTLHNIQVEEVAVAVDVDVAIESHEAGLAGALAQLRIGVQRTPEQEQYENLMRRQCWESGQIDYAGADSFDNIWKKITQTLEAKPEKDAEADQTDNDNDNDNDFDNDNDNTLGYKKLLTQTAIELLQPQHTAAAVPRATPTSQPSPSPSPSSSLSQSSSSTLTTNNNNNNKRAEGAAATTTVTAAITTTPTTTTTTTNKLPTNAQKTATTSISASGSTTAATQTTTKTTTTTQPQRVQAAAAAGAAAAAQPQHILPGSSSNPSSNAAAPTKPSRQRAMQLLTSADIEDGKVEFDKATGATTTYKVIDGGYEVITTSPQPNGTVKTSVRTFWDPKPVSEEDLVKEQANKKIIKQRLGKEIRIDERTTMLTRAIEGGYEEVYTTVNEDGSRSTRTKTFFDSVPQEINEQTNTKVNKHKKNVTRKSSVDSTDSTESSSHRRVVHKTQKNVISNSNDQQSNYQENTTIEETRSVSQNIEITENNRTVRKNSLQEQSIKAVTQTNTEGGKQKKKKAKSSAPPPPADFVQNDTTTVASKRVPGGVEYTYSTELESGKTITTSKTVYEEEEVELTEEEIRQYKKTLKDAEKHKNVTSTKKLKSESGTKKIVPSENPGDVTTVETIKIEGGTEYHYTTVTAEGIVKKAVKTVFDPVPTTKSNPDDTDEEEIIEEYEEEIIEPGEKTVKTIETIKQLPHKFEEEVTITHEKKEKKVKKSMVISQ